jgi:hypothetical protein
VKPSLGVLPPKTREGLAWQPMIGRTCWTVGLVGPEYTFSFEVIYSALGRPVLPYRR